MTVFKRDLKNEHDCKEGRVRLAEHGVVLIESNVCILFQIVTDYIRKQPMLFFQNFAENTMNELLGWYGYDKVELKDGEDIEFRSYPTDGESRQHISVLKGNDI